MSIGFFQRPLLPGTGHAAYVRTAFIYKESGLTSQTVYGTGSFLTSQIGPCLRQGPWAVMRRHSRGENETNKQTTNSENISYAGVCFWVHTSI